MATVKTVTLITYINAALKNMHAEIKKTVNGYMYEDEIMASVTSIVSDTQKTLVDYCLKYEDTLWITGEKVDKLIKVVERIEKNTVDSNNKLTEAFNDLYSSLAKELKNGFSECLKKTSEIGLDTVHKVESFQVVIDEFNRKVENGVNSLILHQYLKSNEYKESRKDMTGVNSPSYIKLNLKDIKSRYMSGESPDSIAKSYRVSGNTIRKRLKELGVFIDGRLSKGGQ